MSYKNLNYIIEIAQQRNISRAAEKLFISQSALSIYLRKLEKELGISLFIRYNNTLIPTPEGELFIETAKKIICLEQELYLKILPSPHQLVTFGISSELVLKIFSIVFSEFKESHPTFKVSIVDNRAETLIKRLKDGTVNFIIIPNSSTSCEPWMHCELLKKEEIVFVIPSNHNHANLGSYDYNNPPAVDISVFKNDTYVIGAPDTVEYDIIQRIFNDYHINPDILCEINLTRTACQLAQDKGAITLQPNFCVPRDINALVCRPLQPYYRYMQLIYYKNRILSTEEKLFIKSIKYAYDHWYD